MGDLSNGLRFRVFMRDKFTCVYCGRRAPDVQLNCDHKVPKAAGGRDDESNLVTACFQCNNGKRARLLTDPVTAPAKPVPPPPPAEATLVGCSVLRPVGQLTCEDCEQPEIDYWKGHIERLAGPGLLLVQWYSWLDGSETNQSVHSLSQLVDEGWKVFEHTDQFYDATERVLKLHDHDHLYDFGERARSRRR